ncbi:RagB/SusD family nutrient uptake outer membrane protein [Sphingobacterium daejeonense]|uniref:RagB/SusD family nutrient uptake outer membrane protein n=1 Tax=Sphingobacterium daejeonense TaxID=371142 RepID=UPI0021A648FD|nr:RagB/SusD family nutrient uptake outer membrane protein [Sphingobacterium daejeonense]MCT1530231.1 RagB/SusD family nutrient uptake outer membrane protein [Sphingobacterium daejeonense]
MKKKSLYIIALASLTMFSCKDFLDVKPTNSTDSSVTIQTLADAKVMINGLTRKVAQSSLYGRNMLLYGDTKGGDLTIVSQGRGLDALYVFNHSVNNNNYADFWTDGYNAIMQANNIIKSIDGLQAAGTELDFNNYEGQALTFRALLHFDLVKLYGKTYTEDPNAHGVPVVTELLETSALPLRSKVVDVYTQIIADLEAAAPLLSKTKSNGYINYYLNRAILSRVYMTMGNYDKALATAEEIIDSKVYSLYSNSEWVSSWANQFGKESIFEITIAKDQGDLGSSSLGFYYLKNKVNNALGNFTASDYFLERLGQDETDVRWGIFTDDELERQASCYKYVGSVEMDGDGKDTYTAVNIKVARLSEIYLNAAESALKKSSPDKTKAATYLNEIRKRSPKLPLATAATVTEQMILDEKSKELYGEGFRYWDMIRTNKTITFNDEHVGVAMTHREKSINRTFYKTILPIPRLELDANPGLEEQQNPGY